MNKYNLDMLAFMNRINQLVAKQPPANVYEVWETNADLENIALLYSGPGLDWAESKALKLLAESVYSVDYMVYCKTTQEIIAYAFSDQTKANRGECLG